MIKFLRHIRKKLLGEGKTGKYLKYAVGEVFLVVVGILLALQVNNWNEIRKEKALIYDYTSNLVDDLNQDIAETQIRIKQINHRISFIDSAAKFIRHKKLNELSNLDLLIHVSSNLGYRPYTWHKATMDELKNSGSLKSIENDSLRIKIISYYALTIHLDEDFIDDRNRVEKLENQINKIINFNYQEGENLYDTISHYRWNNKVRELKNTTTYKKAKTEKLTILTNNINDIHSYMNNLLDYKTGIETRSSNELPRLIKQAEEIIEMIKEEYHN